MNSRTEHPLRRLERENAFVAERNRKSFNQLLTVLFLLVVGLALFA